MIIKKTIVNNTILLYSVIYLSCFVAFDKYIGRIPKYVFYSFMILGVCSFIFERLKKNNYRKYTLSSNTLIVFFIVTILFSLRSLFIFDNQQLITAFYQYVFYFVILLGILYYVTNCDTIIVLKLMKYLGPILGILGTIETLRKSYFVGTINAIGGYSYLYIGQGESVRSILFSNSFLTYGMLMAIYSVVAFYYVLNTKKLIELVSLFCCVSGLWSSGSRGPLVAFIVSCIFMYIVSGNDPQKKIKKVIRLLLLLMFIIVIIALLYDKFQPLNSIVSKIKTIFVWDEYGSSNARRVSMWIRSLDMIYNNIIFGVGPAATGGNTGFVTESGLLKRFVETGVIIAGVYYLFIFMIIKNGIKSSKRESNEFYSLGMGIFISIMIEDIVLQITEEISIVFFLWFAISLLFYHNAARRLRPL